MTKFEATWLASREACVALDKHLSSLIAAHWKLPLGLAPELVLPTRCEATADALPSLGLSPSHSLHCTILLALLGELLLCAESGGILRKAVVERFAAGEPEREVVGDAVRLLRNAVCHPASISDQGDETGIASFADFVLENFKEETWAKELKSRPGELARRETAFFALRLIDDIGWDRATRWSVKLKGAKRPHAR